MICAIRYYYYYDGGAGGIKGTILCQ